MNPQTDQTPGFGMPQPPASIGQAPPMYAPQNFHAPENATTHFTGAAPSVLPTAPSIGPLTGAAAPGMVMQQAAPIQSAPMPGAIPMPAIQTAVPTAIPTTAPVTALPVQEQPEDVDTPQDEEWVSKAKDIIEHTHGDPYTQSIELSKLKAQYIKARYNKDVKVSE